MYYLDYKLPPPSKNSKKILRRLHFLIKLSDDSKMRDDSNTKQVILCETLDYEMERTKLSILRVLEFTYNVNSTKSF